MALHHESMYHESEYKSKHFILKIGKSVKKILKIVHFYPYRVGNNLKFPQKFLVNQNIIPIFVGRFAPEMALEAANETKTTA